MISELDRAYGAMQAGGEAEGLAFYRALADAELFLLLDAEAEGDAMSPQVFDLADGAVLLAFDSEERLAAFAEGPQPYAALPGRVIAAQMVGQGPKSGTALALGLNLGSASEVILPPEALIWLMQMLDQAPPEALETQVERFVAPAVPPAVLAALSACLTGVGRAYLTGVRYRDGRQGQMLALTGVAPDAEAKVARAVTEALAFSGIEAGALDIAFLGARGPGAWADGRSCAGAGRPACSAARGQDAHRAGDGPRKAAHFALNVGYLNTTHSNALKAMV